MKYVDQNEAVLYETHFHPFYYSAAWIISIFFLALAIWSAVYTKGPVDLLRSRKKKRLLCTDPMLDDVA